MADSIRVLTYNIRYVLDRWSERRELLLAAIRDADPEVVGLQEVNLGGNRQGQDKLLCDEFGMVSFPAPAAVSYILQFRIVRFFFKSYAGRLFTDFCAWFADRYLEKVVCMFTTPNALFGRPFVGAIAYTLLGAAFTFGNALLTRLPVECGEDRILLGASWRVASRIVVQSRKGKRVVIVNCHLQDGVANGGVRAAQIRKLLTWVNTFCGSMAEARESEMPCVLLGDFNATPQEEGMGLIREEGFKSAYYESHGCEPDETFHQHHDCIGKDVGIARVTDYIWIRGPVAVGNVRLIGNAAKSDDATLWPSDHYGVVADVVLH